MRMPWRARSARSSAGPTAALPRRSVRRGLAIGSVPLLLVGTVWLTAQPAQAAIGCRVDYSISCELAGRLQRQRDHHTTSVTRSTAGG